MSDRRRRDARRFRRRRRRAARYPTGCSPPFSLAVLFLWLIAADGNYRVIFAALRQGVLVTLWVTVVAFALAAALGLLVALGRTSRYRVLREVATFYVEIIRGIPVLVLLFYVAFVGAPQLVALWNWRLRLADRSRTVAGQ